MDVATLLGLIVGAAIMAGAVLIGGSPLSVFLDLPSVICVAGGALCAVMICYPIKTVLLLPQVFLKAILHKRPDIPQIVAQLVALAEIARRDGLLALDHRLSDIQHPFLRLGVQMAVDGTRPAVIEEVLRTEIQSVANRHSLGKGMVDQLGRYSPAFGLIGTLLGLVMMLNKMTDPSQIGAGMSVALLTTLYGAVFANMLCLPVSEKLAYYNREEIHSLEIIVKGVLAIQSGENPRNIEQRLSTVLHPNHRRLDKAA